MGHSILQRDTLDEEDFHCEKSKRRKLRHSSSTWLSCFHLILSWPPSQRKSA